MSFKSKLAFPVLCLFLALAVFGASYALLGVNRNSGDDLFDVITGGDSELLEQVLRNGADPNTIDKGISALHWAILGTGTRPTIYGQVKTLIAHGANPNLPSDDGLTPVHAAAMNNAGEAVMEALLDAGGNPLNTATGVTPYQLALITGSAGAVTAIMRSLGSASEIENLELLQTIGEFSAKLRSVSVDATAHEQNAAIGQALNGLVEHGLVTETQRNDLHRRHVQVQGGNHENQ